MLRVLVVCYGQYLKKVVLRGAAPAGGYRRLLVRIKQDVGEMMRELDCGCGCHLEGNDEQCLIVKVFSIWRWLTRR